MAGRPRLPDARGRRQRRRARAPERDVHVHRRPGRDAAGAQQRRREHQPRPARRRRGRRLGPADDPGHRPDRQLSRSVHCRRRRRPRRDDPARLARQLDHREGAGERDRLHLRSRRRHRDQAGRLDEVRRHRDAGAGPVGPVEAQRRGRRPGDQDRHRARQRASRSGPPLRVLVGRRQDVSVDRGRPDLDGHEGPDQRAEERHRLRLPGDGDERQRHWAQLHRSPTR